MNRRSCFQCLSVFFGWSLLVWGLPTSTNALTVSLTQISPVNIPVAGDTVILRCEADNLHVLTIEWAKRVNESYTVLARNGTSLVSKYTVFSSSTTPRYEHLVVTLANKQDTGWYQCRVQNGSGSSNVSLSREFYLSVYYFPTDIYPVCHPHGKVTVPPETTQHVSCTSEKGNPTVQMDFVSSGIIYPLEYSDIGDTQQISLNLDVFYDVNGLTFECKIASPVFFPDMERSCVIGPICVNLATDDLSTAMQSTISKKSTPLPSNSKTNSHTSREISSLYYTSVTQTVSDANDRFSKSATEVQTSRTDKMTTRPTTETTVQSDALSTVGKASLDIPVAVVAGVAGGGGFLILLLIISTVIACSCLCGCRDYKRERHVPPRNNSTLPNTISQPIVATPAARHQGSHNRLRNETWEVANGSGQRPEQVHLPDTPKPSQPHGSTAHAESVNDSPPNPPKAYAFDTGLYLEDVQLPLSDSPTLRISARADEGTPSSSYTALSDQCQEPLYAELRKSKRSLVGKGTKKDPVTRLGSDSRLEFSPASSTKLPNPTYALRNDERLIPSTLLASKRTMKIDPPVVKQVTWKM